MSFYHVSGQCNHQGGSGLITAHFWPEMFQQCYICSAYVTLAFCYQLIPYICIDIGWCEVGELSGGGGFTVGAEGGGC